MEIEGRAAVLFRLLLGVKRQKRPSLTMSNLSQAIMAAYLHSHETDIMEDVTEEIQRAADEAYVRPRKLLSGFPGARKRPTPTGPAPVPNVPDGGAASVSCVGRRPMSFADAVGDKAAE